MTGIEPHWDTKALLSQAEEKSQVKAVLVDMERIVETLSVATTCVLFWEVQWLRRMTNKRSWAKFLPAPHKKQKILWGFWQATSECLYLDKSQSPFLICIERLKALRCQSYYRCTFNSGLGSTNHAKGKRHDRWQHYRAVCWGYLALWVGSSCG